MQAQYRIFPTGYDSEVHKYSTKPLPKIPYTYLTDETSASYTSLLDLSVDSSSLIDRDEITRLWDRVSQYSAYSVDICPPSPDITRTNSLATIAESFDSFQTPGHKDCQLPTPPPSPVITKRSATPTLLEQLSFNLEELSIAQKPSHQHRQNSPDLHKPTSQSFATVNSDPFPTGASAVPFNAMEITTLSTHKPRKAKATNLPLMSGHRNISPPIPSPVNANTLFGPPLSTVSANDSSYQQCRPPPRTPDETQEVSCIEWDDDEESKSRLTRMKKSFTDLRAAGKNKHEQTHPSRVSNGTSKVSTSPSSQGGMRQISAPFPTSNHSSSNATTATIATITTFDITSPPRHQQHTSHIPTPTPSAKLSKKPSIKVTRKRGWSQTSSLSPGRTKENMKECVPSTPNSISSASTTTTALPRAESPHLLKNARRRFSVAGTRKKGRVVGARRGRMSRWFGKLFGC